MHSADSDGNGVLQELYDLLELAREDPAERAPVHLKGMDQELPDDIDAWTAVDDKKGGPLDPRAVYRARMEEMGFLRRRVGRGRIRANAF